MDELRITVWKGASAALRDHRSAWWGVDEHNPCYFAISGVEKIIFDNRTVLSREKRRPIPDRRSAHEDIVFHTRVICNGQPRWTLSSHFVQLYNAFPPRQESADMGMNILCFLFSTASRVKNTHLDIPLLETLRQLHHLVLLGELLIDYSHRRGEVGDWACVRGSKESEMTGA